MVQNTLSNGHAAEANGYESCWTSGADSVDGDQYKPRSILITGGAGFIASHVVMRLLAKDPECKVSGFVVTTSTFWV